MYVKKGCVCYDSNSFLSDAQAEELAITYLQKSDDSFLTQDILDSNAVPRLRGFKVKSGKVSDSIFGGNGSYFDKEKNEESFFVNPPLVTKRGIPLRLMIRSSKISTHDIVRGYIPFKDQVLAINHEHMHNLLKDVLGTSQFETFLPDTSVVIAAENLQTIPLEMVLREYVAKTSTKTSVYHSYFEKNERSFAGHVLPNDLIPNGKLPYVMDTPSTKSDLHDETIDREYIFAHNVCTPSQYMQILHQSLVAFGMIRKELQEHNVILVDVKTEHGINHEGKIKVQDEFYTIDSARFWVSDDYEKQLFSFLCHEISEINPIQLSKEFARTYSTDNLPYSEETCVKIAVRYIKSMQTILGKPFVPDIRSREERVVTDLKKIVDLLAP